MSAGSLREQLESAVTEVEEAAQQVPTGTEAESPQATQAPAEAAPETAEQKAGRTAGRARDEQGRLLPGAAKKDSAAPQNTATPSKAPEQASPQVAAETPKPLQRPSTLKKELWPVWDKLAKGEALTAQEARQKAEWILQRDSDYAKGVSTYKGEADAAKPLMEAIAPFQAELKQHGIDAAQHVQRLFSAHRQLALGQPQERLAMFAQLARDYQVDLGQLFVKGQDGQIYLNPQLQQAAPQRQQQPQQDPRVVVQEILAEERARSEVERMKADTETYPHFEAVRNEMVGLLQSGLATDYASAYEAAIRLPQHSNIFEAQQQQQREQAEREQAEAKRKAAEVARRNAFSPRTSTPTAATAGTGKKGLRDQLTEAVDAVAGGRV